jgi:hypothetical protein
LANIRNEELDKQPIIGEQLNQQQWKELQEVLKEFEDVLRNEPGQTALAEHHIDTGSHTVASVSSTTCLSGVSTEGAGRDA